MTSTRILAVLAALVAAAFLSACSSSPAARRARRHDHGTTEPTVTAGEPAGFNADDVAFATNMIPHHQQAVDLSAHGARPLDQPRTVTLAQQIAAAQQPEIDTMKVFLVQWKENPRRRNAAHGAGGTARRCSGMVGRGHDGEAGRR